MFSLDNFLFDHLSAKSRNLFDEFYDPGLAYWPENSWRLTSPKPSNLSSKNFYDQFLNTLMNDIIDTPKEVEIEQETSKEKDQLTSMEVDSELKSNNKDDKKLNEKLDNKAVQQLKPVELRLRLNQYKPEDIIVNVKDNRLTIKGKKESRIGTSYSCQQFERTITLPKDAEAKNILCSMDSNGLIKLNIPRRRLEEVKQIKINFESNEENRKDESNEEKRKDESSKENRKDESSKENRKDESTIPKSIEQDEPIVEDFSRRIDLNNLNVIKLGI